MGGGKLIKVFSKKFRKCRVGNSFVEGTLVSTPVGLVPIETIEIGDLIYSYDEESGEVLTQEVVHLIQGDKEHKIITLNMSEGAEIRVTDGHPFYIPSEEKWVTAEDL